MSKYLRILGLPLLATTAIMAASASAAHAKWLLLRNGKSVVSLNLNVTANERENLVPELGLEIYCAGGIGTAELKIIEGGKKMIAAVQGTYSECLDLNFAEVCAVMGTGDPNGTISTSGTGTALVAGSTTVQIKSEAIEVPFANVQYLGEECPLAEIDGKLTGYVQLEVLKPLEEAKLHQIHMVDQELIFGGLSAEMHGSTEEELPSGSLTEASGESFSIHLVEL